MESLLKDIKAELIGLAFEQRQTNQLLTELNDNFLKLIDAMAMDEPDATPTHDMDGNPA